MPHATSPPGDLLLQIMCTPRRRQKTANPAMFWHVDIPRACQMSPELLLMVSPLSTNGRQSTTKHAMVAVDTTKLLLLPSIVAVCTPLYLVSSKRVDTFNDTSVNALGCSYLSPPPTHRSFVSCVAASCSPAGGCTVYCLFRGTK